MGLPNPLKMGDNVKTFEELYDIITRKHNSVVIKYGSMSSRFLNRHFFYKLRCTYVFDLIKANRIYLYDAKKDIKPKKLTPTTKL